MNGEGLFDRQQSNAHTAVIHNDQATLVEFTRACFNCGSHPRFHSGTQRFQGAQQDDTRLVLVGREQDRGEVKILRHDDKVVVSGLRDNHLVFRSDVANARPMPDVATRPFQSLNPKRAEIHVDQQPHAAAISTSRSSASAAAYVRHASISSASRYGNAPSISSFECPAANSRKTFETVTRRPRMHGLPAMTFGFTVIRFRSSDTCKGYPHLRRYALTICKASGPLDFTLP